MSELALDFRYINLDSREDKRKATEENLFLHGFAIDSDTRFRASIDTLIPALGCARSHYACLAGLLAHSGADAYLIIEDDWRFYIEYKDLIKIVTAINANIPDWNVIQLSATDAISTPMQSIACDLATINASRLLQANSAGAYVVKSDFAVTLNHCFAKSIKMFQENRETVHEINKNYYSPGGNKVPKYYHEKNSVDMRMAIDWTWGEWQWMYNFIGIDVATGYCHVYASDISAFPTDNKDRQFSKTRIK